MAFALALGKVQWLHPAALWALLLPLVVLLVARRRARPEPVAVGTFAIWTRIGAGAEGVRRRRRTPLWALLLALSLAAGALALARPRRASAAPARRWTVVVDQSPSMFLAHTDSEGRPTGAGTRLDAAVDALDSWLAANEADVELEWTVPGAAGALAAHAPPGEESFEPPRPAADPPAWTFFDRPGVVWLTDGRVHPKPVHAGVVASGGGPVPGPVGTVGTTRLDWDGSAVREVEGASPRCAVAVDAALPAVLRAFVAAWAEERGLDRVDGAGPRVTLEVRAAGTGDARAVRAGRDGWSVSGRAARVPLAEGERALARWLAADDGTTPLVARAPGVVLASFVELEDPRGDPAAFAVSWAALLDDACLPAPGVVSLDERAAVGEPVLRAPEGAEVRGSAGDLPSLPLDASLAFAAATLAVLAAACGAMGAPVRAPRRAGGPRS